MKSILITGGSGFFGEHFVRRLLLLPNPPDRIVIFSRGEHRQAELAERISAIDIDNRLRFFIGDIRDLRRLSRACHGIEAIVHAAALKRIQVGLTDPEEMALTNVMGTINVIQAARDESVRKCVLISSDKAYQPTSSAYGLSKALAERIFLSANETSGAHGPRFSVSRYGNVAGSTGSVIPRWGDIIASGGTEVPCTDPDCTRFWMRASEAVNLVLDTLNTMKGGEVAVPVLPAFRLGDLAEAMGVKVKVTGLPSSEKKHESMDEHQRSDRARRMSVEELRTELSKL